MAESVYAQRLKRCGRKTMWVRVPLRAFRMTRTLPCNIAIIPPRSIATKAMRISAQVRKEKTFFTLDGKRFHPHVTLYMTEFPKKNIALVKHTLREYLHRGRHFHLTFDRYRHSRKGFVDARFKRREKIVQLHKEIVQILNPFREGLLRKRDKERFQSENKQRQKNLRLYGYRDAFSLFSPHLTFTRLKNPNRRIVTTLDKQHWSFIVQTIGLFQSSTHGTCKKLLATFHLP